MGIALTTKLTPAAIMSRHIAELAGGNSLADMRFTTGISASRR
jgi:hypothetical protein